MHGGIKWSRKWFGSDWKEYIIDLIGKGLLGNNSKAGFYLRQGYNLKKYDMHK